MATVTPNFNWPVPTSTDLVRDGAVAIEALGDSIDASMVDLKGGTTGQVLAKASNTDMDFAWVAQDDSNAIQNSIVDAKGDLIAATANDTPARLAVGTNGQVLTADSTASTGLAWSTVSVPTSLGYAAGKNKVINGDFNIWQRGTSFSSNVYNADRWINGSDASVTITRETFTAGTAPVAGYEGTYFCKVAKSAGGSYANQEQRIEDVRTFAGQTVTLSFWAKAGASFSLEPAIVQSFGSGGSSAVALYGTPVTLTTSWARYSFTVTLASISGKTIGTGSYLAVNCVRMPTSSAVTIDIWGVQLEAGSTATAFQTATGTIQGELAACQRYYYRVTTDALTRSLATGIAYNTTNSLVQMPFPVTMRIRPSALEQSGTASNYASLVSTAGLANCTAVPIFDNGTTASMGLIIAVATGLGAGNATYLFANSTAGFLGWSAEL